MRIYEYSVQTPDHRKLYSWFHEADSGFSSNPVLIWVHGFAEHSHRYSDVVRFFAERGYSSVLFDLRGHGYSEGKRGHIDHFNQYLLDLYSTIAFHKDRLENGIILLGHSMGGLIVTRFAQSFSKIDQTDPQWTLIESIHKKYRFHVRHFFLISPLLGFAIPIPKWKQALAKLVGPLFPHLALPTNINAHFLSHDATAVKAYEEDARIFRKATLGWFLATKRAIELAHQFAIDTPGPISILAAGEDFIVDLEATKRFYSNLPHNIHKSLTIFDHWYHEILQETQKREAYEKLLQLIRQS